MCTDGLTVPPLHFAAGGPNLALHCAVLLFSLPPPTLLYILISWLEGTKVAQQWFFSPPDSHGLKAKCGPSSLTWEGLWLWPPES